VRYILNMRFHDGQAVIGRGIIDQDDFIERYALLQNAFYGVGEKSAVIVIHENGRNAMFFRGLHDAAKNAVLAWCWQLALLFRYEKSADYWGKRHG
jgi:hypothetical protein